MRHKITKQRSVVAYSWVYSMTAFSAPMTTSGTSDCSKSPIAFSPSQSKTALWCALVSPSNLKCRREKKYTCTF